MKRIARFIEEFAKKVRTLLKGGGNKELPSSFSTSPSARDLEEEVAHEQKISKWLVFELKLKLLPLFPPLLSGGVEQIARFLLELSVDSKKVEELIYTLVSEMQHQRKATLTKILGTQEKQGSPYTRPQEKSFPALQRFGIPIDDTRVHENIFRELFRIRQICLQKSTMYLTL